MNFRQFFCDKFSQLMFGIFLSVGFSASHNCHADNYAPFSEAILPTAVTVDFIRKYGTSLNDELVAIAADSVGNVYIAGNTAGSDWNMNPFIRKYSSAGVLVWTKKLSNTNIKGLTLDKNNNIYIVGDFYNSSTVNKYFAYLEKFDPDGKSLWQKQFSTPPSYTYYQGGDPTQTIANGIAMDLRGGNFIVILFELSPYPYQTRQVYIRKYMVSGVLGWEKPVGASSSPYAARPVLAVDASGNIYTAYNTVAYQNWNAYLNKFNAQGNPIWTAALYPQGSSKLTYVHGITTDANKRVYVTGITGGDLQGNNLGYVDAFVRKYSGEGNVLWTRQFGTSQTDYANSITTDAVGNVYVAGSTLGDLQATNKGNYDAFVRKFGTNGNHLRTRQFGSSSFDIANNIKVDGNGSVYVGGNTQGNLGGTPKGGTDVYFRKYAVFK